MREIKFRGFYNNQWVYGSYVSGIDLADQPLHQIEIANANEHRVYDVDPASVGENTGLKDKSGKDIYEGDIVDGGLGEIFYSSRFAQFRVRWNEKIYKRVRLSEEGLFTNSEIVWSIIGNIYENPKLLKTNTNAAVSH